MPPRNRTTPRNSAPDTESTDTRYQFQPAMPDIPAATQPGLLDGWDPTAFDLPPDRARAIAAERPAERMLIALRMDFLTPTARIVAVYLAYRGWISWPSRANIAKTLRLPKNVVSRAMQELKRWGFIIIPTRRGSNSVEYQYQFPMDLIAHVVTDLPGKPTPPESQIAIPTPPNTPPESQIAIPTPPNTPPGIAICDSDTPENTPPGIANCDSDTYIYNRNLERESISAHLKDSGSPDPGGPGGENQHKKTSSLKSDFQIRHCAKCPRVISPYNRTGICVSCEVA